MFCSFEGPLLILRLYGKGFTVLPGDAAWETFAPHFTIYPSTRQIIVADIDLIQTSCGFGVPLYDYAGERIYTLTGRKKKARKGFANMSGKRT
ncbi:MAG: hypothetical protein IPK76_06450 [Lewinellaceae bacterium]|nr:hypothetical protein [Lewinellaceae bacterium]